MDNIFLTGLTLPELKSLFRRELEQFFDERNAPVESVKKEWLNIDETAELINTKKQTVYGLVSRRQIPFSKKGKRLYFNRTELLNWIAEGRKPTCQELAKMA